MTKTNKKNRFRINQDDYVKANRKASRELEIEMYGHPLPKHKVHESKKVYNRNRNKAGLKDLPYFLLITHKPSELKDRTLVL